MGTLANLTGGILLIGAALPGCGEGADERAAIERSDSRPPAAPAPGPAAARRSSRRGTAATLTSRKRDRRPSVDIVRPADGRRVRGDRITVTVSIDDFRLVEQRVRPPFPPPVPGRGHVHFYLDTGRLPTRHGPPATGAYRSLSTTSYTWVGVPPGRHSLAAQLVGKDHVPLRPQAKDRITVDVG